ncbi:MAG: radical SAM protein [Patescibacteria group bacterium]
MNIILISPSQGDVYGNFQPPYHPSIGLGYIGAVLEKQGHNVKIIDIDADRVTEDDLRKRIVEDKIDLAGIMVLTPIFTNAVRTAHIIKKCSNVKVVFGGMHPTIMPQDCLKIKDVDFVVIGEGEQTILELINQIQGEGKFKDVKGVGFKKDEKIIINENRPLIEDLDSLPFPAMRLFNNIKYTYPDAIASPTFPIVTSRGCPGTCTYCSAQSMFGRKFRARSAVNIVDEIEKLIKDFGVKEVHIWDDNFVTIKERVLKVRDEIKKRAIFIKFAFPNGVRADFLDKDVIGALKEMGTYSIGLGIESGNNEILRRVKKNINLDKIKDAVKLAKKSGIEVWGFFMLGLPGETKETVNNTIKFAIDLDPDIAKFHILKPYPGTEVFKEFVNNNLIDDFDFSHYGIHTGPVHHLKNLAVEEMNYLQRSAYKKFYFRPSKIINQIIRLKSFTRIKLNIKVSLSVIRKAFTK